MDSVDFGKRPLRASTAGAAMDVQGLNLLQPPLSPLGRCFQQESPGGAGPSARPGRCRKIGNPVTKAIKLRPIDTRGPGRRMRTDGPVKRNRGTGEGDFQGSCLQEDRCSQRPGGAFTCAMCIGTGELHVVSQRNARSAWMWAWSEQRKHSSAARMSIALGVGLFGPAPAGAFGASNSHLQFLIASSYGISASAWN